ncbi:MAG: sugar kinase [Bacteroidetes bacterium]|nr:sugar kinase [Bacteroidota bacterium]MCL5027364.1 sugar kinase [Chloroflexota bacterium]
MSDVVTFGETMVRLTPPHFQRLEQTASLDVHVGGTELNTAVALARLGVSVSWVSRLVRNPLGRMIANKAREHNVDVSQVLWTDEGRVGLYFLEEGASPRPSQVVYDRRDSAFSRVRPDQLDWQRLLAGARLFHTTGITPAVSACCREATRAALETAHRLGVTVSFDMNYRSRLWSLEAARECFLEMLPLVDILYASAGALETFCGIRGTPEEAAARAKERYGLQAIALTTRDEPSVLRNRISSIVLADRLYRDRVHDLEIVDRLGAGDAYSAGIIYGYLQGNWEKGVAYAGAMAALKHTMVGDLPWFTVEEIEREIAACGSGLLR